MGWKTATVPGPRPAWGWTPGLARYYNPERNQTWRIGLEATFKALFDWADGGDLESRATDYWVGLNTSFSQGPWQAKLVFAHLSSHPGDYTLLNEDIDAEKVSWEVLKGTVAWSGLPFLRLYAGGSVYLTHTDWAGKGDLQAGAVLQYDIQDSPLTPYLALDLQFRERTDWDVSTSVEGGIRIAGANSLLGLRLYAFYYNGDNPSGTFRKVQEDPLRRRAGRGLLILSFCRPVPPRNFRGGFFSAPALSSLHPAP